MSKKYFIITIDTEGDNLWEWDGKSAIGTENAKCLPRFQKLCDSFGFKPVWLTNYEMINDPFYRDFICQVEETKTGELGMHLHAWNTPPEYELVKAHEANSYLIEYPVEVMEEKIRFLTEHIEKLTGIRPSTHRAGRWAMNEDYFDLLQKYGYRVDCSVTPHVSWEGHVGESAGSKGSDYVNSSEKPYFIRQGLLEVPVTIRSYKRFFMPDIVTPKRIAGAAKRMLKGQQVWLRPHQSSMSQIRYMIEEVRRSDSDYLMFMLHSSEFMPGGSPNFRTKESIEELYKQINDIFTDAARDFQGITLREYGEIQFKKRPQEYN